MSDAATRKARERDRKAASGLVRIEVWVPPQAVWRIREEAREARERAEALDALMDQDADLV